MVRSAPPSPLVSLLPSLHGQSQPPPTPQPRPALHRQRPLPLFPWTQIRSSRAGHGQIRPSLLAPETLAIRPWRPTAGAYLNDGGRRHGVELSLPGTPLMCSSRFAAPCSSSLSPRISSSSSSKMDASPPPCHLLRCSMRRYLSIEI